MQAAYYKRNPEEIEFKENVAFELSGNIISLQWKPMQTNSKNIILFQDGERFYSTLYFNIESMKNNVLQSPLLVLSKIPANDEDSTIKNLRHEDKRINVFYKYFDCFKLWIYYLLHKRF